ncbi:MAG: hypothetical protein IPL65_18525 [Lewinellaceae bacterium]|nr:hypothetical protein [Lewinellaceae bacterium]
MHHRLFVLLLCCCLPLTRAAGQDAALPYRLYTIRDGLAQQKVRCFLEDSRGYTWVGTNSGFSRFDGRTLQPYGRKGGLSGPPNLQHAGGPRRRHLVPQRRFGVSLRRGARHAPAAHTSVLAGTAAQALGTHPLQP